MITQCNLATCTWGREKSAAAAPLSAIQSDQGHLTLSWLPLVEWGSVDGVGVGPKQVGK